MNNADKPAYPMIQDNFKTDGLTKREKFAMADWTYQEINSVAHKIKDEINSGRDFDEYVHHSDPEIRARARVQLADALLKQLEETQ